MIDFPPETENEYKLLESDVWIDGKKNRISIETMSDEYLINVGRLLYRMAIRALNRVADYEYNTRDIYSFAYLNLTFFKPLLIEWEKRPQLGEPRIYFDNYYREYMNSLYRSKR